MKNDKNWIHNYLITSGLFALYQFIIEFMLVFPIIKAYPYCFIFPWMDQTYYNKRIEEIGPWISPVLMILLVFLMSSSFMAILLVSKRPVVVPKINGERKGFSIDGNSYEVLEAGGKFTIIEREYSCVGAAVFCLWFIWFFLIPINILQNIFSFIRCLFSEKYRKIYEDIDFKCFWEEALDVEWSDAIKPYRLHVFSIIEVVIGLVIIILTI